VYLEVESESVINVTENATPSMVAQPAPMVDNIALAASALPVKIKESRTAVSIEKESENNIPSI
jgi:hypothetical protein